MVELEIAGFVAVVPNTIYHGNNSIPVDLGDDESNYALPFLSFEKFKQPTGNEVLDHISNVAQQVLKARKAATPGIPYFAGDFPMISRLLGALPAKTLKDLATEHPPAMKFLSHNFSEDVQEPGEEKLIISMEYSLIPQTMLLEHKGQIDLEDYKTMATYSSSASNLGRRWRAQLLTTLDGTPPPWSVVKTLIDDEGHGKSFNVIGPDSGKDNHAWYSSLLHSAVSKHGVDWIHDSSEHYTAQESVGPVGALIEHLQHIQHRITIPITAMPEESGPILPPDIFGGGKPGSGELN